MKAEGTFSLGKKNTVPSLSAAAARGDRAFPPSGAYPGTAVRAAVTFAGRSRRASGGRGRVCRRRHERGRRRLRLVGGEAQARRGGRGVPPSSATWARARASTSATRVQEFSFAGEGCDFFISGGRRRGIVPRQLHLRRHLCQFLTLVSLLAVAMRRKIRLLHWQRGRGRGQGRGRLIRLRLIRWQRRWPQDGESFFVDL